MVVPLSARGRTFGVIALGETREQLRFGPADLKLAATLARQCAQALDRARLYDVERRSREQAAVLLEAGALLASSLDPETTLRTLVRIATPTLGDLCTVDVVTEGGDLCLVAVAHVDRSQEEMLREIRRHLHVHTDDPHPAAKAVRTGKPQVRSEVAESHAEAATLDDEQLRVAIALGARSAVFLPLLARGKVLGVLTLGQIDLRYAPGDVAFLQEFARRAALALDNARLYEAEQRERKAAEDAAARALRLQLVTAALSEAVTPAQVADAVVSHGLGAIDGSAGVMARRSEDGRTLDLVGARGVTADFVARWWSASIDDKTPITDTVRTGETTWVLSSSDFEARYPHRADTRGSPDADAFVCLPLKVEGRTVGALGFGFAAAPDPSSPEAAFLSTLANQCALALERARLYDAERLARAEAEAASRLKDEFLGIVSHELRTPLNAILGWARMLRSGAVKEASVPRALETIERNASLQAQLVEDLMDASRIITGKLGLDFKSVRLQQVIEAAVDSVSLAAAAKGIKIEVAIDSAVGPGRGDEGRLQQIVWNLLTNAVKFSPRGGRVEIVLERAPADAVQIIVRDNGEGISPEFLPHVFDRFRQGDGTTTRRHGGLGLGLSIVRHLVEAHGGTVRAQSDGPGRGATFTIELPLASPAAASASASSSDPDLLLDSSLKLKGLRLLVVEDEADSREILRRVLALSGAEVQTAGSVSEALPILLRDRLDALVSDIGMPFEDGYALIRKVRALEPNRGGQLPAVALTAYATSEDRMRVLEAGYQMHLPKPVDAGQLTAAIAELIGGQIKSEMQ
jgi:signal transduction histidine kinase/ActR/RegA family two-component response regulator